MKKFKNLKIWQEGMKLVIEVYNLTKNLPDEEKFGLNSQMRRCAVSIPSNIAEGYGRNSDAEFNRFLNIARGSSFELETQLIISKELGFSAKEHIAKILEHIDTIQRGMTNLQKKLK